MRALRGLGILITGWTFVLMMVGGYVKAIHAGLACPDWPTCYGQWLPPFVDARGYFTEHQIMAEWVHRFLASFLGPFLLTFAFLALRDVRLRPWLRYTPMVAIMILGIQVVFGGLTVTQQLQPLIVTSHLGFATIFFGMMLATTVGLHIAPWKQERAGTVPLFPDPVASIEVSSADEQPYGAADAVSLRTQIATEEGADVAAAHDGRADGRAANGRSVWRQRIVDYLSMMKLRVSFLLVLTAVTAMFLANHGAPPLLDTVAVVLGGILMVGGAGAINHWLERESDKLMERTADRPLPSGRVPARHALLFGLLQGILAFILLYHFTNLLAALFAMLGLGFYVFVYTMMLKRATPQNITIGGIAGGFPVLVGWSAMTGSVDLVALVFMLLIVVWTPPHFWALALLLKDDYRKAGIPMMPAVKGVRRTTWEMLVYAALTVVVSLSFFFLDVLGRVYFFAACVLGGLFLALAVDVHRDASQSAARNMFGYSIIYLGLLYAAMLADLGMA